MTDDEKKKMLDGFRKPAATDDDVIENDWSEDEILTAAKRIIRKMGLKGQITDPEGEEHERNR